MPLISLLAGKVMELRSRFLVSGRNLENLDRVGYHYDASAGGKPKQSSCMQPGMVTLITSGSYSILYKGVMTYELST